MKIETPFKNETLESNKLSSITVQSITIEDEDDNNSLKFNAEEETWEYIEKFSGECESEDTTEDDSLSTFLVNALTH